MKTTIKELKEMHNKLVEYIFNKEFEDIIQISVLINEDNGNKLRIEVIMYSFKYYKIFSLKDCYEKSKNDKILKKIIKLLDIRAVKIKDK